VIAGDHVGDEVVLEGDEVAAGAVEGVAEGGGLAGEEPAVGAAEELAGAVGELLVGEDVDQLGAVLEQVPGGAVTPEELEEAVGLAHLVAEDRAVADPADGHHAAAERDKPDPVAGVAEVVGRERAGGVTHAGAPAVGAAVVHVGVAGEAAPDRGDAVVGNRDAQVLEAGDRAGAAAGVDDPARAHGVALLALGDGELVHAAGGALLGRSVLLVEVEVVGAGAEVDVDAVGGVHAQEVGLEAGAVDLKRGEGRQAVAADLAHVDHRGVPGRGVEEEAQAVLRQLVLVEIGREAEPPQEIVGGDLHGRLADLEAGLAAALEHRDRQLRQRATQLAREQVAGEAAAEDRDVDAARSCLVHGVHD
jgi:hypothetical protein